MTRVAAAAAMTLFFSAPLQSVYSAVVMNDEWVDKIHKLWSVLMVTGIGNYASLLVKNLTTPKKILRLLLPHRARFEGAGRGEE